MTRIIVDPILRAQLEKLSGPAHLCDETGRVFGRFVPEARLETFVESPISREEIERRKQSTEWYTTEEVLKRLEQL